MRPHNMTTRDQISVDYEENPCERNQSTHTDYTPPSKYDDGTALSGEQVPRLEQPEYPPVRARQPT